MILKAWNYLRGHVVIEVSGFSVERFINLSINKNIYIWDIEYKGTKVLMKVSIKGYRSLKPICKKTKCKMKIIKKYGCPFLIFKYRKRKILAMGIFSFVIILYILSSFIWSIDIDGYDYVEYSVLRSFIENEGIKIGSLKMSIDSEEIEENILNSFPDISWVNLNLKGTKAKLSISETLHNDNIMPNELPSDIIADKDGIITSIVTRSGKALVIKDDVVKIGDTLVTGELKVKEDELGVLKRYVSSDADIFIKKYYDINFNVNRKYNEKFFTGNESIDYRFNILNKNFSEKDFEDYYKNSLRSSTYHQLSLGDDYPLPFVIIRDTYKEFEYIEKEYSIEELYKLANSILNTRILREFSIDVDIVDKSMEILETKGGVSVKSKIIAIEPLGIKSPINETTHNTTIETADIND